MQPNLREQAPGSFGDWLRQRRRERDLTRPELARLVGCSPITLRKLETEERRPSKQMAERLADVLGVSPADHAAFLRFARGDPFAELGSAKASEGETPPARPNRPRHNLPLPLTRFIGREPLIAHARRLLAAERLVTLTGAGGSGKTRLALQVVAGLLDAPAYPDGIWFVELAPLVDATLVPMAIATALGLKEAPGRPVLAVLLDHLLAARALLVLDNCEHLVQASAEVIETLLRACPHLTVLAISREALDLPGEYPVVVTPLSTPQAGGPFRPDDLAQYEAVQLFVDRAASVLPGFQLTPANAPAVARLCRALDGLPLAIELAAARVKLLTVDQIADRLGDRFRFLAGGGRTALARHQTLSALMDWSYDLLAEGERLLLRRLTVFVGGWTLEAAEIVCSDGKLGAGEQGSGGAGEKKILTPAPLHPCTPAGLTAADVLDTLAQLVNKSMVVAERPPDEESRYRLLETIRQYALAKLESSGELEDLRRRHAAYCLKLAEANRIMKAGAFFDWSERLDREHDNLRAALAATMAWGQSQPAGAGIGLRLAGELWSYWQHHGYWSEARAWQQAALALPGLDGREHDPARARVLAGLGIMFELQGDYAAGQDVLARSLALFQDQQDGWWTANVLHWLGWGQREQGQAEAARRRLDESLALFRKLDDRVWVGRVLNMLGGVEVLREDPRRAAALLEEGLAVNQAVGDSGNAAWSLNYLGHVAQLAGDPPSAARRHTEALALFRELGLSFGVAWAQHGLGETALAAVEAETDSAAAQAHLAEALELFRDLGDRAGTSWCLAGLAGVAVLDEEPARAARLWGAAEALRQAIGARTAPASRATRERLMAEAREALGEEAFAAAWAEGEKLTAEQAIELALAE